MSLNDAETNIPKYIGNISKLPKAELTPDKVKWLKDVGELLKKGKTFQTSRDALNKRIKEAGTLGDDIKKFNADYGKFIEEATKVRQAGAKLPDTKGRDIFMIGNYLVGVGTSGLSDYP